MKTAKIELTVNLDDDGETLLNVKVGDEPSCPILKDKPIIRRLEQNIIAAAKAKLGMKDGKPQDMQAAAAPTPETAGQLAGAAHANQKKT